MSSVLHNLDLFFFGCLRDGAVPINMKTFAMLLFVALIAVTSATGAQAQTLQAEEDFQSWNDVQLTVPLTKQFDFVTQAAFRIGKNVTRLNDARHTIGFVWKPTAAFSIYPFFTFIGARNSTGRFRNEHRFQLRATYRFPIKKFGLIHRSQLEYRVRSSGNTWRYRPSLTFEKDLPANFIPKAKLYITEEPFYDSATDRFSRNRFTVGITKTLSKQLAVDIYYMRQNDGFSRPGDLNVIGTSWKIKM